MKKPTTILKESVSEYREFVQLRLRKRVLEAIEVVLEEEVDQALGCCSYERAEDRRGYRNGAETRRVTTSVGTRELRVPRARVRDEETGETTEFRSELLPRYARRTREVDEAILGTYLSGANSRRVRDLSLAGWRIYLEYERWRVNCSGYGGVHVEHLDWLANNSRYTQRFATHVGKLCRDMPNKAVAEMERLHHGTVKALDTLYMQEQVDRAGLPAPRAIGVDEISIRKGHNYRVIVSDLERARPIWVGGEGRKETDIDLFFKALGGKKSARIKLAAIDMWKPFRNSVIHNAPNARIIFDKFHIMRHLSKALDEVRRGEYKRLSGKDRSYIKGQRYTLLSRRENLSLDGRHALKKLLQANRRLNTAYILKEAFGQLWDYRTERGARAFFTRWKDSLKWQRLHPYQKFAGMIESHWDGIASYCHPENKVSLGLVEGVNNKIRVLQRRAYGYRDEEYLKLKIVAAFLPPLPRNAVFNPHESA